MVSWPSGAQQPTDPGEQGKELKGPLQQPRDGDVTDHQQARWEKGNLTQPFAQQGLGSKSAPGPKT